MSRKGLSWFVLAVVGCFAALYLSSCGSSNSSVTPNTGMVNVMVSDPATCSGPQGTISHVFVTITDVQIHTSATAGPNDPGWVDLTPNLKQNPMQVDLMGQANNQCFLATLGSTTEIQPGTYQQIRIYLAPNSATVSGNKCGSTANCVMSNSNPTSPQPLLLSSESQTGIKIPSGQIAGGQFTVAAGQTKDLDIDFNGCESIVAEGNGQFRLKPVLHAGEVGLTSASINGKIVDGATSQPISGGNTIVALEQKDSSGVDRVIMQTLADSTGAFVFCPVPTGTYDVVATAVTTVNGLQVAYGATVITGVQPGNSLGTVPLTAQVGANQAAATVTGLITTSTGSAATTADISISALQSITVNGSPVLITVPLAALPGTSVNASTAASATCPANTDCVTYKLTVPAANPSVGAFNTTGTQTPAAPAGGNFDYTVDARAFAASAPDCTKPDMQTSQTSTSAPLAVLAGGSVTAQTIAFSGCQ
jgi:Domain of unknown function (DUF4382)